jgi:hypothetical protein
MEPSDFGVVWLTILRVLLVVIYTILFAASIDSAYRKTKDKTLTVGDVVVSLILSPAAVILIPIWIVYEITSRIGSVLGRILSTPVFRDKGDEQ